MADDLDDPFEEGRHYPSTMERWPDSDGPWQVTFDWKVIDGRIECCGVHIESDATAVTSGVLRDMRIAERIRQGRAQITVDTAGDMFAPNLAGLRRKTQVRLRRVAEVYTAAYRAGQPPAKAVEEQMRLTQGRASSLISQARDVGLLPPTSRGAPQA
jgi:hypothetical protein